MKILNTIQEIKMAVDSGNNVFCDNQGYRVLKNEPSDYYITYTATGYSVGLHGREGTAFENKLNGTKFFTL